MTTDRVAGSGQYVVAPAPAVTPVSRLTSRQMQALRLAASGLTRMQVADRLGLSVSGAQKLFDRTYERLGATCLPEALTAVGWLVVPDERAS